MFNLKSQTRIGPFNDLDSRPERYFYKSVPFKPRHASSVFIIGTRRGSATPGPWRWTLWRLGKSSATRRVNCSRGRQASSTGLFSRFGGVSGARAITPQRSILVRRRRIWAWSHSSSWKCRWGCWWTERVTFAVASWLRRLRWRCAARLEALWWGFWKTSW